MVVNEGKEQGVTQDEHAVRLERLLTALEALTNMLARLVGVFEASVSRNGARSARSRRIAPEKPISVTPVVQAAVKRALARIGR